MTAVRSIFVRKFQKTFSHFLYYAKKNFYFPFLKNCSMIKFNEIKQGDYMMGEFDGKMWRGEVTRLNGDEKQVCLKTDVQDFWFENDEVYPIPLNDETLHWLNFKREDLPDGIVKYKKGSFRLVIKKPDDFSYVEMWYREDVREHPNVQYVHQLQNQYLQMTKVHLTNEVMV